MPSENVIVGLDIGTSKVCAIIGEYDENDTFQIIGVGTSPSEGLRRGVVINIEATLKSVSKAVEAAEMMSGRLVKGVYTGIAGGHIEGINSRGVVAVTGRGREITNEDVNRVIDAAKAIVIPMDREVLHVIPQEFIVDEQGGIRNPLDMIGVRLEAEVHIITGSVTSAQNLVKCVNRAGFKVNDIVLESLAAARAVLSDDEKELGVLLIDLGGGTTDILVYLEGAPYFTGVVPLGGAQVTGDVSIVLKIPIDAAERIKQEVGSCYVPLVDDDESVILPPVGGRPPLSIPRKNICSIIQSRMAEILGMVREQVEKKGFLGHLGGGVVLTGGGALLPGTAELAAEVFGLPTRVGFPSRQGGLEEDYRSPAYATAVGLALYGAEKQGPDSQPARNVDRAATGGVMEKVGKWFRNFF